MTCSSCVHLIERTLHSTRGVIQARVALTTSHATVEFDPSLIGPRDVLNVINVSKLMPYMNINDREKKRVDGVREEEKSREGTSKELVLFKFELLLLPVSIALIVVHLLVKPFGYVHCRCACLFGHDVTVW